MKRLAWRTAHFEARYFCTENGVEKYCIVKLNTDGAIANGRIVPRKIAPIVVEMMECSYHRGVQDYRELLERRDRRTLGDVERELLSRVAGVPEEFQREDG